MANIEATFVVDVRGVPELIWQTRAARAAILRAEADAESNPAVARKLRAIADEFEAGRG